jgi:two-component sensor histidine kinase
VEAQRVDGTPLWIAARAEVVRGADGRIVGLRGTNQDITDYKQAEQSAIAAERARAEIAEHMGDEIDHRVKNNLAMVSGLLQMQLLREQDPHIAGALRDAIGRIRTFVTLHEQMYAARTEEADLLVAVQQVAATMGELFAARDDVAINVRGDPFRCSARCRH